MAIATTSSSSPYGSPYRTPLPMASGTPSSQRHLATNFPGLSGPIVLAPSPLALASTPGVSPGSKAPHSRRPSRPIPWWKEPSAPAILVTILRPNLLFWSSIQKIWATPLQGVAQPPFGSGPKWFPLSSARKLPRAPCTSAAMPELCLQNPPG